MHPATAMGDHRRHATRSLAVVAALIAAFVVSATLNLSAVASAAPAPLKAVIIVGPTHGATADYLAKGEALADLAETYDMDVRRVFHPYATWANVKANAQGANLVAYFGHGNGWPSPYTPFQEDSKDGFGLNEFAGGSQNSTKYYGANKIRAELVLAPNAIVFLNHLCYAEGNGEPGMARPTYDVARQRVDNYAAGFLAVGARAVFAYGWQTVRDVLTLLMTTHQTMDGIFETRGARSDNPFYGFVGWDDRTFDSVRMPGFKNHLDPDPEDGYLRAVSGDLTMTSDEWKGGNIPDDGRDPVISALTAVRSADTIAPTADAPTIFTPNGDGLSDALTLSHTLSEGAYIDWTVANEAGNVVKRFTAWADGGTDTSTWDGTKNSGSMAPDGRYDLTAVPKDRAGNVGDPATVRVRLLTSLKAPTVSPTIFYARDLDALAPTTTMKVTLTRAAMLSWKVTDTAGNDVAVKLADSAMAAGTHMWTWNGTRSTGAHVADGVYYGVATARTDAGTYSHRVTFRIGAFHIKGGANTVTAGQKVTYTLLSSEPITGWPKVTVIQPGLSSFSVSTVRYDSKKFTAAVTFRSGGTPGAVTIKVSGTDTGGQVQVTKRTVTLQ
jgi:flagellar hook assembly protein FlgD